MRWVRGLALLVFSLILVASLLWITGRSTGEAQSRPAVAATAGSVARGAAAFAGEDFGGISMHSLESSALPWRLAATALVLDEQRRNPSAPITQATLRRVVQRFGFLYPNRIANLPPDQKIPISGPKNGLALGMTYGDISPFAGSRIMVSNLGCASCHAGVTYSADGTPDPHQVMLGTPNTSLDLEAYTQAIFTAMRRYASSDRLLQTANELFPEMDWRERQSLRWIVLPLVKQRIAELQSANRAMPFPNGTPGSTNGVAALKTALEVPLAGQGPADAGIVSIPDLGDRALKTSLLVDGAYAIPGKPRQAPVNATELDDQKLGKLAEITTFFTVPSMGVHPDTAQKGVEDVVDIMAFLKAYRPQTYPGEIDRAAAGRGAQSYKQVCASCHGDYAETGSGVALSRFPNWIGDVGTDRLRQEVFDQALVNAISKTSYHGKIAVSRGGGYVAPPLTGIWATAPYLHNGSVPSLAALLTPSTRPSRFMVGGHALDFAILGIRHAPDGGYPKGYLPFADAVWIDTHKPGKGNAGHNYGEELTPQQKRDLMEFLKRL